MGTGLLADQIRFEVLEVSFFKTSKLRMLLLSLILLFYLMLRFFFFYFTRLSHTSVLCLAPLNSASGSVFTETVILNLL